MLTKTQAVYHETSPQQDAPARRHRLTGTVHRGPHWTSAVRVLRVAVQNAVEHAWAPRSANADFVGTQVIDQIGELDAKSLHVLAVTFAVLVRASRRNH